MVRIPDYDQQIQKIETPMPEPVATPMPMASGGSVYIGKNFINPQAYSYMYDGISNMLSTFGDLYMGMKKLKFEQTKFEYDVWSENRKKKSETDSMTPARERPADPFYGPDMFGGGGFYDQ